MRKNGRRHNPTDSQPDEDGYEGKGRPIDEDHNEVTDVEEYEGKGKGRVIDKDAMEEYEGKGKGRWHGNQWR